MYTEERDKEKEGRTWYVSYGFYVVVVEVFNRLVLLSFSDEGSSARTRKRTPEQHPVFSRGISKFGESTQKSVNVTLVAFDCVGAVFLL